MLIVCEQLGEGWGPISYMVRLCAELFEAELVILRGQTSVGVLQKLLALAPRRRGSETCLLVSGNPRHLGSVLKIEGWKHRFGQIAAWVIDGFWTDAIPRIARNTRTFDQFFITTDEDVDDWRELTRCPTSSVPWGSDVLRLGTPRAERSVDILRVGRQPSEWDDDAVTCTAARAKGLSFHGRPEFLSGSIENQRMLMRRYGDSKFLLAFSNAVHSAPYTHPTRAYLTGRWTDGLAAGAVIAGIAPKSPTADRLLWPGATLNLSSVRREDGLAILAEAVAFWRPEQAAANYYMALQNLDWRWRFAAIAAALGESPSRLFTELDQVKREIAKANDMEVFKNLASGWGS